MSDSLSTAPPPKAFRPGIRSNEATRRIQAASAAEVMLASPQAGARWEEASRHLPAVGGTFLGFDLVDELGKGSFGTVFLAKQKELADRPVALKVSADLFDEPAKLARLQHAAIMPVYSTHQTKHFQAVCMPFFGRATVADLYASLRDLETLPRSGQHLVSTLESKRRSPSHSPGSSAHHDAEPVTEAAPLELPAPLASLSRLPYIDAILLTGARIAEGLAHAHERGIIHQDLKPANILLTDEGLPMILDFNLARSFDPKKAVLLAQVGGTIPYMSPEQLEQFVTKKVSAACPVDGRSDVYALGLILYQLLAGAPPCYLPPGPVKTQLPEWLDLRRMPPPPIRNSNPAVAPAVESIVRKCLEADPARRYQSARDLVEDIERHRDDLPLKHAPNPSLAERFRKWCRRNPRIASARTVVAVTAVLLMGLAGLVASAAVAWHKRDLEAQHRAARVRLAAFADAKEQASQYLSSHDESADWLARGSEAGLDALRPLGALDDPDWLERPQFACLLDEERQRLKADAGELAFLLSRGLATAGPASRRDAKRLATVSARCLGGDAAGVGLAAVLARSPLSRGRQEFLLAAELQGEGKYAEAKKRLVPYSQANPGDAGGWFLLGRSQAMLGELAESSRSYSVAIALKPRFAPGYYNRAILAERMNDGPQALADLDAALKLEPGSVTALIARAVLRLKLRKPRPALEDIDAAIQTGRAPMRAWLARADIRERLGDKAGAKMDREKALAMKATDAAGLVARGNALLPGDTKGAIECYAAAEKLSPRSVEPLQNLAHVEAELLGKPERAVGALNRLIKLHPDYVPGLCGRAVYLARAGRLDDALAEGKRILALNATPYTQYRVACVYAIAAAKRPGLARKALRLVAKALERGEGHAYLPTDSDLDAVRANPAFKKLIEYVEQLRTLQEEARDAR